MGEETVMHFYAASYATLWRTALRSSAGQASSCEVPGIKHPVAKSCKAKPTRALNGTCPCPAPRCTVLAYGSP